jgi:hypothetical protein
MAVQPTQLIAPAFAPDTKGIAYTSTAARTRIDYMAFLNTTASNVTLSIWLGPAGASQRIKDKTILPGECYLCPEVIGALLMPGQLIEWVASAAGALYGSANGVTFT